MISRSELRRVSARLGLGLAQAEHEYALLCALDGLSQTPSLGDTFCLKGGTALRQLYFADWRHSVDLDFTVLPDFPPTMLREALIQWFAQVEALHGLQMTLVSLHKPNGAARVRARFVGPLDFPNKLLLDITLDEAVLLPLERRPIVTGLFAQPTPIVLAYALTEILAEKMRAIVERGKARDYYDVWRLLKEKRQEIDLAAISSVFESKCAHKGLKKPTVAEFFSTPILAQARVYWDKDLSDQMAPNNLPPWEQVVSELGELLPDVLVGRRGL